MLEIDSLNKMLDKEKILMMSVWRFEINIINQLELIKK